MRFINSIVGLTCKKGIERLQKVLEIIGKCQERIKANDMQLEMLKNVFNMLKHKYKEEYVMHNLKYMAVELAGPLVCHHE